MIAARHLLLACFAVSLLSACERPAWNYQWEAQPPLQIARRALAATAAGDYLYALGGVDADGRYVNTVEFSHVLPGGRLEPWQFTTPLPAGRIYHSAVAVQGNLYILGGGQGELGDNNTPVATVDTQHGFIVNCDVTSLTNEDPLLVPQIDGVKTAFGLESPPPEVLMDGLNCTGTNLQKLEERNITAYGPSKLIDPTSSPAWRADLSQPVPQELWDKLPRVETKLKQGQKFSQLSKDAFIFDAEHNGYWCPNGCVLTFSSTTSPPVTTAPMAKVPASRRSGRTAVW